MASSQKDTVLLAGGIVMAIIGLVLFTVSSIGNTGQREVDELRQVLYDRCIEREEYDRASQATRMQQREYWIAHINAERLNTFIDDALRQQRIETAQRMIDSFDATLATSVPPGCDRYKPEEDR